MRMNWNNIADAAIADLNGRIEAVGRAASWDNIPTWNDLNNSLQMEIMRRKASWSNLGMSDEEIAAEIYAEMRAAQGGGR